MKLAEVVEFSGAVAVVAVKNEEPVSALCTRFGILFKVVQPI